MPYRAASLVVLLFSAPLAFAEDVQVKYQGTLSLDSFECRDIDRSSFINRLCYDEGESAMILLLKDTYYKFCDVEPSLVDRFESAPSMGKFFNSEIKGQYDC